MKTMRRITAVFLAALLLFSGLSVLASADFPAGGEIGGPVPAGCVCPGGYQGPGYNIRILFRFFREDPDEPGSFIFAENGKAARGDKIRIRVYLETDFHMGTGGFLYYFTKNNLAPDYDALGTCLTTDPAPRYNPMYNKDPETKEGWANRGGDMDVAEQWYEGSSSDNMTYFGTPMEFFNDHGFVLFTCDEGVHAPIYDVDVTDTANLKDWWIELPLIVRDNAEGEAHAWAPGYDEKAICVPDEVEPYDEGCTMWSVTSGDDFGSQYTITKTARHYFNTYFSKENDATLTFDNTVTLDAGDGAFAGEAAGGTKTFTGWIKSDAPEWKEGPSTEITNSLPQPSKEGVEFLGWQETDAHGTPIEGDPVAAADIKAGYEPKYYKAQYSEAQTGVNYTVKVFEMNDDGTYPSDVAGQTETYSGELPKLITASDYCADPVHAPVAPFVYDDRPATTQGSVTLTEASTGNDVLNVYLAKQNAIKIYEDYTDPANPTHADANAIIGEAFDLSGYNDSVVAPAGKRFDNAWILPGGDTGTSFTVPAYDAAGLEASPVFRDVKATFDYYIDGVKINSAPDEKRFGDAFAISDDYISSHPDFIQLSAAGGQTIAGQTQYTDAYNTELAAGRTVTDADDGEHFDIYVKSKAKAKYMQNAAELGSEMVEVGAFCPDRADLLPAPAPGYAPGAWTPNPATTPMAADGCEFIYQPSAVVQTGYQPNIFVMNDDGTYPATGISQGDTPAAAGFAITPSEYIDNNPGLGYDATLVDDRAGRNDAVTVQDGEIVPLNVYITKKVRVTVSGVTPSVAPFDVIAGERVDLSGYVPDVPAGQKFVQWVKDETGLGEGETGFDAVYSASGITVAPEFADEVYRIIVYVSGEMKNKDGAAIEAHYGDSYANYLDADENFNHSPLLEPLAAGQTLVDPLTNEIVWYTDPDFTYPISASTTIPDLEDGAEIPIYAKSWAPVKFTLTDDQLSRLAEGSAFDNPSVAMTLVGSSLSDVTEPEAPATVGHERGSWDSADLQGTLSKTGQIVDFVEGGPLLYTVEYKDANLALDEMNGGFTATEGEVLYSENVPFGAPIGDYAPSSDPEKDGFDFDDWYDALTGGNAIDPDAEMPAENLTFYAQYIPVQYTIAFDADGGTPVPEQITADYGARITPPAGRPSKPGNSFVDWHNTADTANPGSPYTFPRTMPLNGASLKALWMKEKYTLSFNANDGDPVPDDWPDVEYDSILGARPETTKPGYTFQGWFTDPDCSAGNEFTYWNSACPDLGDDGDTITLYAKWTVGAYVITFNTNGGTPTAIPQIEADYDAPIEAPDDPTWEGHTFGGWLNADDNTAYTIPATMPDRSYNLIAKWDIETYTLIYNGTEIPDAPLTYGGTMPAKPDPDPVREGYTFGGWFADADKTVPFTEWGQICGDKGENGATVNVYAKWDIERYTLVYNGTEIPASNLTYNEPIPNAPTPDPAMTGYTFDGWFADAGFSSPFNEWGEICGDKGNNGDTVDVYAKWNKNQHTLTFVDEDKSTELSSSTVDYDTPLDETLVPDAPEKPGYTFLGWRDVNDDSPMPDAMPDNDAAYYPAYQIGAAVGYDIEVWLMTPEGTYDDKTTTHAEAPAGSIQAITPFDGNAVYKVDDAPPLPNILSDEIAADGSTVLRVYYARRTRAITFNATEGGKFADDSTTKTLNLRVGATIPVPEAPTLENNAFAGWDPAVPETVPADEANPTAPSELVYNSTWALSSHTLTYMINGTAVHTDTCNAGDSITSPYAPSADELPLGMGFLRWEPAVPETMPDADLVVHAVLESAAFEVEFRVDGELYETKLVAAGGEIPVPAAPDPSAYEGLEFYTFAGWNWAAAGLNPDAPRMSDPGENKVVEAIFDRIPVKLIPQPGSTTVIDYDEKWIYGLQERMTDALYHDRFLDVEGDGYFNVVPLEEDYFGTGCKIKLYDRVTGELLETYTVIIFGDLNGDSVINQTDDTMAYEEAHRNTFWSDPADDAYDPARTKAADVKYDEYVDGLDISIIKNDHMTGFKINQVTGTATA